MNKLKEYESLLNKITKFVYDNNIEVRVDFISTVYNSNNSQIKECIDRAILLRRELGITEKDVYNLHIILEAGSQIYTEFKDKEGAFCVSNELMPKINNYKIIDECSKYNPEDNLFIDHPNLLHLCNKDYELINITQMTNSQNSRILNYGNIKLKISERINPSLINYLRTKYPMHQLFVRIDKDVYDDNIWESANEDVLRSEKSHWYKNMLIYNGDTKKATYQFPESFIKLDLTKKEIEEFRKKGDNGNDKNYQLQTFFKRNNKEGLLIGSLEEFFASEAEDVLISKYLHLTSTSAIGTKWEESSLGHIDGAINVYFDKNVKSRVLSHIDDKVDSDCRTHLFRINNIPITELVPIAKLFFKSIALVEEWEEEFFEKNE